MSSPRLSVVIRCRNEASGLRRAFAALRAQRCDFVWETVVVDNESDDETCRVCEEHQARVITLKRADFTYGRALNAGIAQARGELILLLSAHVVPVGPCFLQAAVEPFDRPEIAAARCLMAGSREQIADWHRPKDLHFDTPQQQQSFETGLHWLGEYPTAGCCVIRRSVWESIPFDETLEANEDKLWASAVLARGHTIRSSAPAVWHYNLQRGGPDEWRKVARQHLALYRARGWVPMTWGRYAAIVGRAIVEAPLVAARHVAAAAGRNWYLLDVPRQARRKAKSGSIREYEQKR